MLFFFHWSAAAFLLSFALALQHTYIGQHYIELSSNDSLLLSCSSRNITSASTGKSTHLASKQSTLLLEFGKMQVADTGNYTCNMNDSEIDSLYVFVHDPDKANHVFLNQESTTIKSNGTHLIVPCKANRLIDDDLVKLHLDRLWMKNANYDSRLGFVVKVDDLENLRVTTFRCTYEGHISQAFNSAGDPRWKPMISATEWAVAGEHFFVDCMMKIENSKDYKFVWIPEDDNSTYYNHYVPQENTIWSQLKIFKGVASSDGENYTCILQNITSGENITSSTITVPVGTRIGQVRLYNATHPVIDLENNQLLITFFADVNGEEYEYWRNWSKIVNGTEEALSAEEAHGISNTTENGVHKEKLLLNLTNIYNGTIYQLELHVPWYVLKIRLRTDKMINTQIMQGDRMVHNVVSPFKSTTFICTTLTALLGNIPPTISYKRKESDPWVIVNTVRISPAEIQWTGLLQTDTFLKCDNGNKEIIRHIAVMPWIETNIFFTPSQSSESESGLIHSGDTVTLNCTVLSTQTRMIKWYNEKSALIDQVNVDEGGSSFKSLLVVKTVSVEDSGIYKCSAVLRDGSTVDDFLHLKVFDDEKEVSNMEGEMQLSFAFSKDGVFLCSEDEIMEKNTTFIEKSDYECRITGLQKRRKKLFTLSILHFIAAITLAVLLAITVIYARGRNSQLKRLKKLHELLIRQSGAITHINKELPLHEQVERLPYDENYEIKLERLLIIKPMSSGAYGRVYIGKLRSRTNKSTTDVAVKGPKDASKYAHIKAVVDELRILTAIGIHPNVLCLIGAVTENIEKGDDIYIIMELCDTDLKNYLIKHRHLQQQLKSTDQSDDNDYYLVPSNDMLTKEKDNSVSGYISLNKNRDGELGADKLISFLYQIANGMEHLATKMCVHRDLAARNILLTRRHIVRIADFGLARQCDQDSYQVQTLSLPLPYKSMAPECISELHFTEKSDVWSYGILMWEIFSLGENPYKDFNSIEKLAKFHLEGGRLDTPENMPTQMSELMKSCWQWKVEDRPSFTNCKQATQTVLVAENPQMFESLESELANDLNEMKQYAEWRDGRKQGAFSKKGSRLFRHSMKEISTHKTAF